MDLHWLPIKQRIDFKILLLAYEAINGEGPEYLSELVVPYITPYYLRSQDENTNLVSVGDRAFSKVAPLLWNDSPLDIKECVALSIANCPSKDPPMLRIQLHYYVSSIFSATFYNE